MNGAPHILHLITAFDRGGAENHLAELVRHQRASGMAVTIGYFRGAGGWAAEMRALGATVVDLGLRFYGDLRPLWRLRQLIARGQFDLVHAHLPPAELYARLALLGISKAHLPLVISKHNDCPFHRIPGERLIECWVARRAGEVIAISEAVRRYMAGRRLPAPLKAIPYGIDVRPYETAPEHEVAALRSEWGADRNTLLIGFVGRLVEQKSIDTLISGFALLSQNARAVAKLVIVGDGPLRPALREHAARLGVLDRTVWAGFRADIPRVMRALDVFALTSHFEGFGLVLIEAMAARRAVMATRVSAIPEIVADRETGLLVKPGSPHAVADALERLRDPVVRARFGAAGYRRAFEHFTLERMFQSTDDVYARCLGQRAGGETERRGAACTAK